MKAESWAPKISYNLCRSWAN